MSKRLDEYVGENQRDIGGIHSSIVDVTGQNPSDGAFSTTLVELSLDMEIYTRTLDGDFGPTLIMGHPDAEHGIGRGGLGDGRGGWTIEEDAIIEGPTVVRGGRYAARDALVGEEGEIESIRIGTGSAPTADGDTELQNEIADSYAHSSAGSIPSTVDIDSTLLFSAIPESPNEIGVFSKSGQMIGRARINLPDYSGNRELLVQCTLTVYPRTTGADTVTEAGRETLAQAFVASGETRGVSGITIGSGEATIDYDTPSLGDSVLTKDCYVIVGDDRAMVRIDVQADEPDGQPVDISEAAIRDNEGNIMWLSTFDEFEKNEDVVLSILKRFKFGSR